jgi:hypothetical protein
MWVWSGLLLAGLPLQVVAQTTVFVDTMDGSFGDQWTHVSASGSGHTGDFTMLSGLSVMHLDPGALGRHYARVTYSSLPTFYRPVLSSNPSPIEFSFNVRRDTALSSVNTVATVLAANNAAFDNAGSGYAVLSGINPGGGSDARLRLVRFTTGVNGTIANIIGASGTTLTVTPGDWVNVRVTYDPATNRWRLFATTSPGDATSLPDPRTIGGEHELGNVGGVVDSVHTSNTQQALGVWHRASSGSGNDFYVDNFRITMVPEPTTLSLVAVAAAGVGALRLRRVRESHGA